MSEPADGRTVSRKQIDPRPGYSNIYILETNAYPPGTFEPCAIAQSTTPGLMLHIGLVIRDQIPRLLSANSWLLIDVFGSEAEAIQEYRNKAVDDHRSSDPLNIRMAGAMVHGATNLGIGRPVATVLWWSSIVTWPSYLRAIRGLKQDYLAAIMYTAVTDTGRHTTLVVELHADQSACSDSLDPRKTAGWYGREAGIPDPALVIPASAPTVVLPARGFTRRYT